MQCSADLIGNAGKYSADLIGLEHVAKTKALTLINCTVTAQLICAFVLA